MLQQFIKSILNEVSDAEEQAKVIELMRKDAIVWRHLFNVFIRKFASSENRFKLMINQAEYFNSATINFPFILDEYKTFVAYMLADSKFCNYLLHRPDEHILYIKLTQEQFEAFMNVAENYEQFNYLVYDNVEEHH